MVCQLQDYKKYTIPTNLWEQWFPRTLKEHVLFEYLSNKLVGIFDPTNLWEYLLPQVGVKSSSHEHHKTGLTTVHQSPNLRSQYILILLWCRMANSYYRDLGAFAGKAQEF